MKKLPSLYQIHLENYFSAVEYLMVSIVIMLLQKNHWVRLEKLAENFPIPIKQRSRVKKLQRLLSLPKLTIQKIWFPILKSWLEQEFDSGDFFYLVIDRTQWKDVNLLMISLAYNRRAIPIYFILLNKLGNSNYEEQKQVLNPVLNLLEDYNKVVLGDREFCSVDLAKWLSSWSCTYFSLRLKKNTCIQIEAEIWQQLQELKLTPGMSVYHQGVKVTKTKGFGPFNLAAKWKKTYRGWTVDEAWFLITNLDSVDNSIEAYQRRMGIEEMFRDFKSGGYNLEGTQVRGKRLEALILLITLAYSQATFWGNKLQSLGIGNYVVRPTPPRRKYRQHSQFYLGLQGFSWLDSLTFFVDEMQKLLSLAPQSLPHYQRGLKAITLLQSVF
jgi:hypothetical protein